MLSVLACSVLKIKQAKDYVMLSSYNIWGDFLQEILKIESCLLHSLRLFVALIGLQ